MPGCVGRGLWLWFVSGETSAKSPFRRAGLCRHDISQVEVDYSLMAASWRVNRYSSRRRQVAIRSC